MKGTHGASILPVLDLLTLLTVVLLLLAGAMGINRPEGVIRESDLQNKRDILAREQARKQDLEEEKDDLIAESTQGKKDNEELQKEIGDGPNYEEAQERINQLQVGLEGDSAHLQKAHAQLNNLTYEIARLRNKLVSQEDVVAKIQAGLESEELSHRENLEQLKKAKTSALAELATIQASFEALQKERDMLDKERHDLSRQLAQARKQIVGGPDQAAAQQSMEEIRSSMKETSERLKKMELALEQLEAEMNQLRKQLAQQEEAILKLEAALMSEKNRHKTRMGELAQQKEAALKRKVELTAILHALEQERRKLKEKRDQVNAKLGQLQAAQSDGTDLETVQRQITEIREAIKKASAELGQEKNAKKGLGGEIDWLSEHLASEEKKTKALQDEMASAINQQKIRLHNLDEQMQKAIHERENIQTQISQLEMEREKLSEMGSRLQRELEELQVGNTSESEVARIRRRLEEINIRIASTKDQSQKNKGKLAVLHEQVEEQKEIIKRQEQQVSDLAVLKSEVEEYQSKIKGFEKQTAAKEQKLEELRAVLAHTGKERYSVTSGAPKVRRDHQADKMFFVVLFEGKAIPLKVPFYGGKKYRDGTIVVKPKREGLDIEDALEADSPIMEDVLTSKFREKGQVSILVNSDSFPEFRKLRDFLAKENIPVGWEPLEGTTLAFVGDGSKGQTIHPQ